jgi:hypothetical protein
MLVVLTCSVNSNSYLLLNWLFCIVLCYKVKSVIIL